MASLIFRLHRSVSKFTELQFTVLQRVSFPTPVANKCSLRLVSRFVTQQRVSVHQIFYTEIKIL